MINKMIRDQVIQTLRANVDKLVRVRFVGEEPQLMTIINLDQKGFVNKIGDQFFWATFEDVCDAQPEGQPGD